MKIALMALQFTFKVESTAETNISGTNITDKTPRSVIKYSKNHETVKLKLSPSDRFYQILYSICSRWDFVIYSHPELLFNLIYQSIKYDSNKIRIASFVRRLIQFSSAGTVAWNCGALYLFSAILKIHPFLINMLDLKPKQLSSIQNQQNIAYDLDQYEPKLTNANVIPLWELTALTNHMHPAVRHFAKQILNKKYINYNGDPINDFKRKVLFEKFTKIMAHKMKEFTPSRNNKQKQKDKKRFINSYLAGDAFIAIYKQHQRKKTNDENDDDDDFIDEKQQDLDEDNENDALEADSAMFKWLKSHYGTEIPDDQFDDEEDYDYSDLKQEIQQQQEQEKHVVDDDEFEDSDVDVYVSDVEAMDDDDAEDVDIEDSDVDVDDNYQGEMNEEEKTKLGNKILMDEIENDNILLPSDVEYASERESDNDEDFDLDTNMTSKDAKFLEEEEEVEEDGGDFFGEGGFSAGQLKID